MVDKSTYRHEWVKCRQNNMDENHRSTIELHKLLSNLDPLQESVELNGLL